MVWKTGVVQSDSDTCMSEVDITDSYSDSFVDIQAQQWAGLPHTTECLSRA